MRISMLTVGIATSLVVPSVPALAQCNSYCSVGAFGTGGTSSDGNAQGWLVRRPGSLEGFTIWDLGTDSAGRTVVYKDGELYGFFEGTIRDDICRGTAEGLRFGDWAGLEPDCAE
jgi:hypothetical protein